MSIPWIALEILPSTMVGQKFMVHSHHTAALKGHDQIVSHLLTAGLGTDVDIRDSEGQTPLLLAAASGGKPETPGFFQKFVVNSPEATSKPYDYSLHTMPISMQLMTSNIQH